MGNLLITCTWVGLRVKHAFSRAHVTLPSLRTKESFGMNVTHVDLQRMTGMDSNADHLGVESLVFLGNLQAFSDVMSSTLNVFGGLSENFHPWWDVWKHVKAQIFSPFWHVLDSFEKVNGRMCAVAYRFMYCKLHVRPFFLSCWVKGRSELSVLHITSI